MGGGGGAGAGAIGGGVAGGARVSNFFSQNFKIQKKKKNVFIFVGWLGWGVEVSGKGAGWSN